MVSDSFQFQTLPLPLAAPSRYEFFHAMPALDQFLEALGKPRSGRTVHDVVVEADGQTQVFADLDAPIHHAGLFGYAAQRDIQRMQSKWDRPAAALPEHSDRGHADRAEALLQPERILENEPEENIPGEGRQQTQPLDPEFARLFGSGLGPADLIVKFS